MQTSKVNITLVTSHPLSELVWSPRKGICVKNSGHIITERQTVILCGSGLSNMVFSTKNISKKRSSSDIFIDEKNDLTSPCPVNLDVEKVEAPGKYYTSAIGGLVLGCDEGHIPPARVGNSDACGILQRNASSPVNTTGAGPSSQRNVSTDFVKSKIASSRPGGMAKTLDILESSAENYLLADSSKLANPVSLNDPKVNCRQQEGIHKFGESVHAENDLTNQRTENYLRKGKGKVLSEGDVNDHPAEDTNSHGSAESCNSMTLASSGNTKRSLDQRTIITSKRVKQSVGRASDSATFIKQSSSFMSWIKNMIKGYPEPNHNDEHTPSSVIDGLLTNITRVEHESHSRKPAACSHELRGEGFRNLFHSICCSNYSANTVPLAAYKISNYIPEEIFRSSDMGDHSANHTTTWKEGMILSSNFPMIENKILPSAEVISCNGANDMEMVKSSPCVDKERENYEFKHEEKVAQATSPRRDNLGSLWITRFFPRVSRVLPNSEKHGSSGNGLVNVVQAGHSLGDTMNNTLSEEQNGFAKDEQKPEQNMDVMASVFARRLDALKQVTPVVMKSNPEPIIQLQESSKLDTNHEARNPFDVGSGGQETGVSSPHLLSTCIPDKNSVSTGVFDAVRKLRLSRSDFLRLMDSDILPSNLRGFYLRVRLSNRTQGLGGKSYYVACIHGAPDRAGPKNTVAVTIGSFSCLVESRNISSQDFLQDELVTWWSGHSKAPSMEELEQKYEERRRLGF